MLNRFKIALLFKVEYLVINNKYLEKIKLLFNLSLIFNCMALII